MAASDARKAAERVENLAKEIGQHCEDTVGVIDKIILPYTSRDLRNRWVERKLEEYAAEVRERCAQIADAAKYEDTTGCDVACGFNGACDEIGAAIRAMKGE